MTKAQKLRELAAWYRESAERAGEPWIWEARLKRAEALEKEAEHLEMATAEVWQGEGPAQGQE
jgi:hypothetical protein